MKHQESEKLRKFVNILKGAFLEMGKGTSIKLEDKLGRSIWNWE